MNMDLDKIKILESGDERLKILGELLSNDTSRKIIKALIQNTMYTNQISKELNIRVSLVIHHLKKMESLGLLDITEKKIVKRGVKHRFFQMRPALFLFLDD